MDVTGPVNNSLLSINSIATPNPVLLPGGSTSDYYLAMTQYQSNTTQNHLKRPAVTANMGVTTAKKKKTSINDATAECSKSLPSELTAMFQPLYCKLCSLTLTSSVMAKLHYSGKAHKKKINKYLQDRGISCIPVANSNQQEGSSVKDFYCDVCRVHLTSKLNASAHYMGKNHRKKLKTVGPMQRVEVVPQPKVESVMQPIYPDSFVFPSYSQFCYFTEPTPVPIEQPAVEASKNWCSLCNVHVTSEVQMTMHLNGQKHSKKLKMAMEQGLVMPPQPEPNAVVDSSNPAPTEPAVFTPLSNPETQDLSVFRTPTGQYYCKTCNMTILAEIPFRQHLTSKRHYKNLSQS